MWRGRNNPKGMVCIGPPFRGSRASPVVAEGGCAPTTLITAMDATKGLAQHAQAVRSLQGRLKRDLRLDKLPGAQAPAGPDSPAT